MVHYRQHLSNIIEKNANNEVQQCYAPRWAIQVEGRWLIVLKHIRIYIDANDH